jgi:hypothetical protein
MVVDLDLVLMVVAVVVAPVVPVVQTNLVLDIMMAAMVPHTSMKVDPPIP